MKQFDFIIVLTTFEREEDALKMAEYLVDRKLAACVQIMPIKSIYRWKGKMARADEYLCLIKTMKDLYEAVKMEIKEHHPYEVPEIIAVPITDGSDDYLNWLRDSLGADY